MARVAHEDVAGVVTRLLTQAIAAAMTTKLAPLMIILAAAPNKTSR